MKNKNNRPHFSRLETLARHIESGQLFEEPKQGIVYSGKEWHSENLACHVNGIVIYYHRFALQECPYLFGDHWEFQNAVPVLKSRKKPTTVDSFKSFFRTPTVVFQHVLCPCSQDVSAFGGCEIEFHDGENLKVLRKKISHNIFSYLEKVCSA